MAPRRKQPVDEEPEVLEADESDSEAGLEDAPVPNLAEAETAHAAAQGQTFAWRVLHVIERIPPGQVAAYGQVAALAGAPRNARQVGRMLGDGLCAGGTAPWHRVLSSSGKVSLPRDSGGARQRALLTEEGVEWRESGAVVAGTLWERSVPFFSPAL